MNLAAREILDDPNRYFTRALARVSTDSTSTASSSNQLGHDGAHVVEDVTRQPKPNKKKSSYDDNEESRMAGRAASAHVVKLIPTHLPELNLDQGKLKQRTALLRSAYHHAQKQYADNGLTPEESALWAIESYKTSLKDPASAIKIRKDLTREMLSKKNSSLENNQHSDPSAQDDDSLSELLFDETELNDIAEVISTTSSQKEIHSDDLAVNEDIFSDDEGESFNVIEIPDKESHDNKKQRVS